LPDRIHFLFQYNNRFPWTNIEQV